MRKRSSKTWIAGVGWALLLCMAAWFDVAQGETITYTYDNLNRLISAKYDNGQEIKYTYDEAGNILSVTTKAPSGAESGSGGSRGR
jgi:YD repeat-containing protein